MNEPSGLVEDLSNFKGVAPLFPLPDFVLFPQVTQPLHIFEPRYRQLMTDVLAGDRLLVLGTLKPNWNDLYETKTAPVFTDVCLGRVMLDREMDDGKYIIIIRARSDSNKPSASKWYASSRSRSTLLSLDR